MLNSIQQLRTASRRAQRPREIGSNSPAAGTVLRCLKIARIDDKLPTLILQQMLYMPEAQYFMPKARLNHYQDIYYLFS